MTIVEQLSTYAAGLRYEDLPPEVTKTAKRVIIDSIGCALGGYCSAPEKIARDLADNTSSRQPATLMVSGLKTSPELATFANGVMIRFLDYNDGYTSTGESGHPSDSIAAVLTARGMTGPSPIFDGVGGYFKAVARKTFTLDKLGGRDGAPFKIMECLIKRFPLGQYSQTVVEAALQMREKVSSPDDIAEIQIETVSTAIVLMADTPEKWEPPNRETADHSMPYTVAVALIHGEVQEEHFDDAHVFNPAIRALTRKVKIKASAEADKRMPAAMRCYFKLITKSGETFSTVVDHHRGHFKNPMNDAEIEQKFRALAKKVLPDAQTDRLLARLWKLEDVADAAEILQWTIE